MTNLATSTLEPDVRDVLAKADIDGNMLRMPQLDRKLYLRVDKVLRALGGRWIRSAQAHVFSDVDDVAARVDVAVADGRFVDPRDFDLFETPPELADRIVDAAGANTRPSGQLILEPSAGRGRLLDALRRSRLPDYEVTAIELLPDNVQYLKRNYTVDIERDDFLSLNPGNIGRFDMIVMNPPFSKRRDIDHVQHALPFLLPGGTLVSVVSAGVKFRTDRKATDFRAAIERLHGTIEDLPEDAFKASGTSVRTCLVTVTR